MVGAARYDNMRKPLVPVAYVPYTSVDSDGALRPNGRATFMVRTAHADPLSLAPVLRQEVSRARSDFRVSNLRTQKEIDDAHTVRERVVAMLALFFSATALVLACVGLYGMLAYSVLQRRREIAIRVAVGARPFRVACDVTGRVFAMVLLGSVAGLVVGVGSEPYVSTLLFGVTATQGAVMVYPLMTVLAVAALAALPAVVRALRIAPAALLRED